MCIGISVFGRYLLLITMRRVLFTLCLRVTITLSTFVIDQVKTSHEWTLVKQRLLR